MDLIFNSNISQSLQPCVATVGFFDGVHAGHRFLIEELKAIAKKQNLPSVVFTFAEHPRKVLHSDFQPAILTTLQEKIIQLESTGIDLCVVLHFSPEMAKLTAQEFLKNILTEQYNVRTLLVGHDHRFGHKRTDGFPEYKQYGQDIDMEVIQATRYVTETDDHISSSKVRLALQTGDIAHANRILTYEYSIRGKVVNGFKVGRKIGFPTANIVPENAEKLIPAMGVYAVRVTWNNQTYKGMLNIGQRPTIDNGTQISIEVHIIGFDKDIYNESLRMDFLQKIRDEQKFDNVDQLINQLHKDKQMVLNLSC